MIVMQNGIPSGQEGHAISYSDTTIASCKTCGAGQVEKYRHDCFDFEDVWDQYTWYLLDAADLAELRRAMGTCPNPLTFDCRCAVHKTLRDSCDRLATTWWSNAFDSDELHTKKISLSDLMK